MRRFFLLNWLRIFLQEKSFGSFGYCAQLGDSTVPIMPNVLEMDTFTPIVHRAQETDSEGFTTASFS